MSVPMKLFQIFKSSGESLPVSMAGIKLGDRLLVLGCGDVVRIAQLAVKTGLTGRACAIDEREALVAHAADIAAREGALIETFTAPWGALPFEPGSFDVAVIQDVLVGLAGLADSSARQPRSQATARKEAPSPHWSPAASERHEYWPNGRDWCSARGSRGILSKVL
jgi:hypothetical protein